MFKLRKPFAGYDFRIRTKPMLYGYDRAYKPIFESFQKTNTRYNIRSLDYDRSDKTVKIYKVPKKLSVCAQKTVNNNKNKKQVELDIILLTNEQLKDDQVDNMILANEQLKNDQVDNMMNVEDDVNVVRQYNGDDINGDLWHDFNEIEYIEGVDYDGDVWISATALKSYLMDDPFLDYAKYHRNRLPGEVQSSYNIGNIGAGGTNPGVSILFEMGNKFEKNVEEYLYTHYPLHVRKVCHTYQDVYNKNKIELTKKYIFDGIPIILQGVLHNNSNKTFGSPDIIIRSDYLSKLFKAPNMSNDEMEYQAPLLNGNYHYVIIDIKWTTMYLCADGVHLRKMNMFPAYKGQLAVYTAALGQIQGYTPSKAFVMAKGWKYEKCKIQYNGYNCFDMLGVIDYAERDIDYLEYSKEAINWIRDVKFNGANWENYPNPERLEMYPNMCNSYDMPYGALKKSYANAIKEHTLIWNVGPQNRIIALQQGIMSYDDPRNCAAALGIKGERKGPIIDSIININKENENRIITPDVIGSTLFDWQDDNCLELFCDFETMNTDFYTKKINLTDSRSVSNLLFMIGLGYNQGGTWIYRHFTMGEATLEEEERIVDEFLDYIDELKNDYVAYHGTEIPDTVIPKVFHWTHAEISIIKSVNARHQGKWTERISDSNIMWADFHKVYEDEPIAIKGVMGHRLKDIANALQQHGLINVTWPSDGPSNGFAAMQWASEYYEKKDKLDAELDDIKRSPVYAARYAHNKELIDGITRYNDIDCKSLMEIVTYFRYAHGSEHLAIHNQLLDDPDDFLIPEAIEVN